MEPGNYEEQPPSLQERLRELLDNIKNGLNGFGKKIGTRNLKIIAAVIAIVVLVFLAYSFLPKQASLKVIVLELDNEGKTVEGAQVVICPASTGSCSLDSPSALQAPGITENGEVVFTGLPADTDLLIFVDSSSSGLGEATRLSTLKANEENVLRIGAPKNWKLLLSPSSIAIDATPGCRAEVRLNASNRGDSDAEFSLVSSSPLFQTVDSPQALSAGADASSSFAIVVPASGASATSFDVRAKYTYAKSSVSLRLGEPLSVDVLPSQISCSRTDCSDFITVRNKGKSALQNLDVQIFEESKVQGSISLPGFERGVSVNPGEEKKIIVSISPKGTGAALLTVSGNCFSKQVPIVISLPG
ncbi:MAG TPA: hypothetical protein VGQ00_01950 [Candidatus Norongarragalinales archaeon]|jgi:hypothetical protein|nr:hypothetical protein [Candidatus Norongarragalinales archaeon]